MSFSAITMNTPALASTAPAPTIVIAGAEATLLMRSMFLAVASELTGRRSARTT